MKRVITRQDVLSNATHDMLRNMYKLATPSGDFDEYIEKFKTGELDPEKDRIYEWHYLPEAVQREIVEDYLDAYGANDWLKRSCEFLMRNFKEGGHRTAHKDVFGTGELVRTSEDTEKLNELIGDENAEKVYKLMDDFMRFYRTNLDEMTIRGAIFSAPTCNKETVIEHWGDDLVIDDSVYEDSDEDYDD